MKASAVCSGPRDAVPSIGHVFYVHDVVRFVEYT